MRVFLPTVRDVLNELKWRHGALEDAVIVYRHRGAPDDERAVEGDKVRDLGRSFFQVEGPMGGTMLPYHRILRVQWRGQEIWRRTSREKGEQGRGVRGEE